MRKVIVAVLALTPMLLHAQANSPAQTKSSAAPSTLQSKLVQPKEFDGPEAPRSGVPTAAPLRISTGVIAPKLIGTLQIESDSDRPDRGVAIDRKVVVTMTVDATGKPSDVQIIQPINPLMDKHVLEAISQSHFKPGTLDGEPTAVPVSLEIVLRSR
jgi:TonB family protein